VLQLRDDPLCAVVPEVVEDVVAVPPSSPKADLDDSRPDVLRRRLDRDGARGIEGWVRRHLVPQHMYLWAIRRNAGSPNAPFLHPSTARTEDVLRRDVLSGLIHEYHAAAA
jgi:hypothetical protein